jgi:hypothetical protein
MTLKLSIDHRLAEKTEMYYMDNDAFGYDASTEVSGILWDLVPGDIGKLIDANGNTVGEWEVTER